MRLTPDRPNRILWDEEYIDNIYLEIEKVLSSPFGSLFWGVRKMVLFPWWDNIKEYLRD